MTNGVKLALSLADLKTLFPEADLLIVISPDEGGVFQISSSGDSIQEGKIIFWLVQGTDIVIRFPKYSPFDGLELYLPSGNTVGVTVPFTKAPGEPTSYEVINQANQAKVRVDQTNDPEIIIEPLGN
jgi:hypothetical protein